MSSISDIKKRARMSLEGSIFSKSWILVIVASIIVSIITGTVVGLVLTGALMVGFSFYLLDLIRNRKGDLSNLFSAVSDNLGSSFLIYLLQSVFISIGTFLFIIPGIILKYSLSMAYFIKADHPDFDAIRCLQESRKMMKGYKFKLFLLDLSFLGWYIVGFFCLGIGTLWVNAYQQTAYAHFYEELKTINPIEEV